MLPAHVETSSAESPTAFALSSYLSHHNHPPPSPPPPSPPPAYTRKHAHNKNVRHVHTESSRDRAPQLSRADLTSLKDSHLPNCVPRIYLDSKTYLDYTVYACVTAQSIGPRSTSSPLPPSTDDRESWPSSLPLHRLWHSLITLFSTLWFV